MIYPLYSTIMPKYTFLLPAYKARYLDEMLHSIQKQTYTDFKVLISDDCSPEDIYSVCEPYLQDNRFQYRRNEQNMGGANLVSHWNLLIDLCNTEYLIMASDDDIYASTYLEEIETLRNKYPTCNLFRSRVSVINAQREALTDDRIYEEYVSQLEFIAQCYDSTNIKCVANYVYKTEAIQSIGAFVNFPLAWFSDTATAMLMAEMGCVNTSKCLFFFRQSGINVSCKTNTQKEAIQKIKATLQYDLWLKDLLQKSIIIGKYEKQLKQFIKSSHTNNIPIMIGYDIASCGIYDFFKTLRQMSVQGYSRDHYFNYFKRKLFKLTHR